MIKPKRPTAPCGCELPINTAGSAQCPYHLRQRLDWEDRMRPDFFGRDWPPRRP